jgi:hypothetical protein
MQKRGQVGLFVVIGVVLILAILLIFFFRESLTKAIRQTPTNTQEYLSSEIEIIKSSLNKCVTQETISASKLLMQNGGDLQRKTGFIKYKNFNYSILCREFENGCLIQPILLNNLNSELSEYLPAKINSCMNWDDFENNDYVLTRGNLNLVPQIFEDTIFVQIDYPIKLTRGAVAVEFNSASYNLEIPLGSLTTAVNEMLSIKATGQEVDLDYLMLKKNKYVFTIRRPFPDELFNVSTPVNPKFNFYLLLKEWKMKKELRED